QLALVGATRQQARNVVATVAPECLTPQVRPEWFVRSAERLEDDRVPKDQTERDALGATMGADGYTLLASLDQAATQPEWAWVKDLPAVRFLEQTGAQPSRPVDGHAQRRTPKEMPPASEWYRSPDDAELQPVRPHARLRLDRLPGTADRVWR